MNKVVKAILLAVAAANIGYALWRTFADGRPIGDSTPLFIAAVMCVLLVAILHRRTASDGDGERRDPDIRTDREWDDFGGGPGD